MKKNFTIRLLLTLCLLSTTTLSNAANYYWVGGTGSWSDVANHWATTSGGSVFHASIPSINDDVFIDANSFNGPGQQLLFDSTFYFCHSMTWTGVANHPAFVGNGGSLNLYGSFVLDTGMDISYVEIILQATTSGFIVNTAGHHLNTLTVQGTGNYSLASDLFCASEIRINHGMLQATGHNIDCGNFNLGNGASFDAGAITLFVHGTASDIYPRQITVAGVFTNSNQLVVRCDGPSVDFAVTGSCTVDSIVFTGGGAVRYLTANYVSIASSAIIDNCVIGDGVFNAEAYMYSPSFVNLTAHTVFINDNSTLQVSNNLLMTGSCNDLASLSSVGATSGGQATLSVPSGNIQLSYVYIHGVIATGGAVFNANNSVDEGNNSGWTFTAFAPRNLYWIGGSGNWDDNLHWSLSSGGAATTCAPNRYDHVYFDSNSFSANDSVHIGSSAESGDFTVSGLGTVPVFDGNNLYVYGSFALNSPVSWRLSILNLLSPNLGQTFTSGGNALNWVQKSGIGSYILLDSLSAYTLYNGGGLIDLNHQSVNLSILSSNPASEYNMTQAHIYVGQLEINGLQTGSGSCTLTFDKLNGALNNGGNYSSIYWQVDGFCDTNVTANIMIAEGNLSMVKNNNFHYAEIRKDLTIDGNNSFDSLYLNNPGFAMTVIGGDTTTIVNDLYVNTTCNGFVSIKTADASMATTISKSNGSVNLQYVEITGVNGTGGATFIATNSVDGGGNTGWIISGSAARTLYWINGAGNWSDSSHWSLISGGSGGECIPTLNDSVVFDASSSVIGGAVMIDNANAACATLDFVNAGSNITINGNSLVVYGKVHLAQGMVWNLNYLGIRNQSGQTISLNSGGNSLLDVEVNVNGTAQLGEDLICRSFDLTGGSFLTQNHDMQASKIHSNAGTTFTTGPVTLSVTDFELQGTLLNSKSTDIEMRMFPPVYYNLGNSFKTPGTFHHITLYMPNASIWALPIKCDQLIAYSLCQISASANDTIGKAMFFDYATIGGQYVIDTLFFSNGGQITNLQGSIQINNQIIANGSATFPVYLKGTNNFSFVNNGVDACLSNALIEGVQALGTAQFFAGTGCVDMGSNTNIQFTPCSVVTDVWPGDANYDLNCDNLDVLNIGVAFNETGPVRSGASNSWTAQPAADFSKWFGSAVNMKHADCDGNGIVDINDTIPIGLNYGQTHPARYAYTPNTLNTINAPELYLDATPDTVLPSGGVHVEIMMGTNQLPVDSMYGIAFTLEYDPTLIDTNSIHLDWTGSWLGTPGTDLITFVHQSPSAGRIDVALTRNDHQNVGNGIGHLGMFDVVVVDNISTVTDALFRITNVNAITFSQQILATARVNDTVTIDPNWNGVEQIDLSSHFLVYPNPATDLLNVYSHDLQIKEVTIYDMAGREVRHLSSGVSQISIPLSGIRSGLYQLQCRSDKGVYNTYVNIITP